MTHVEINRRSFEKIIHVEEKKSSSTAKCCLRGMWFDTKISQGDIVSIKGVFNEDRKMFILSNQHGTIVVNSDMLISGTSVMSSLFCARKAILSERFKSVDSGDSKIMHIGTIVHEILQHSLTKGLKTLKEIKEVANEILSGQDIIHLIYSCKISMKELQDDLDPFLTRIYHFMQQYIFDNSGMYSVSKVGVEQPFEGRIVEIRDIEENIWSPRLGLKGKIDATVTIHPLNDSLLRKVVPMEVKTGKTSFSFEHKGQLLLYQMMMQDMGRQVDSGLLLYIRDGIMCEFASSHPQENGLIMMRNRFAEYLSLNIVERDKTINLPDPISHASACDKCPYNVLCSSFLKKNSKMHLPANHPLLKVQSKVIAHLDDSHLSYFLHWCHLITLEHNEMQKSFKVKHLWTKSPEFRAARGSALINLRIKETVLPLNNEFIHQFVSDDDVLDFTAPQFENGCYLIVSTNKRVFITAGRVSKIEPTTITLSLAKDLSSQYANEKFHLDKYESQSQSVFNFSNIGILLENSVERGINRLREIIIDKVPAKFTNTLPKSIQQTIDKTLCRMNFVQRTAILKALTCENYMLIKGKT